MGPRARRGLAQPLPGGWQVVLGSRARGLPWGARPGGRALVSTRQERLVAGALWLSSGGLEVLRLWLQFVPTACPPDVPTSVIQKAQLRPLASSDVGLCQVHSQTPLERPDSRARSLWSWDPVFLEGGQLGRRGPGRSILSPGGTRALTVWHKCVCVPLCTSVCVAAWVVRVCARGEFCRRLFSHRDHRLGRGSSPQDR